VCVCACVRVSSLGRELRLVGVVDAGAGMDECVRQLDTDMQVMFAEMVPSRDEEVGRVLCVVCCVLCVVCCVLCCVVLCCAVLCCLALRCVALCCVVLRCVVLCCVVLCFVVLYFVVQCRAVPCRVVSLISAPTPMCHVAVFQAEWDRILQTVARDIGMVGKLKLFGSGRRCAPPARWFTVWAALIYCCCFSGLLKKGQLSLVSCQLSVVSSLAPVFCSVRVFLGGVWLLAVLDPECLDCCAVCACVTACLPPRACRTWIFVCSCRVSRRRPRSR
jgi:hypothetical protein